MNIHWPFALGLEVLRGWGLVGLRATPLTHSLQLAYIRSKTQPMFHAFYHTINFRDLKFPKLYIQFNIYLRTKYPLFLNSILG